MATAELNVASLSIETNYCITENSTLSTWDEFMHKISGQDALSAFNPSLLFFVGGATGVKNVKLYNLDIHCCYL